MDRMDIPMDEMDEKKDQAEDGYRNLKWTVLTIGSTERTIELSQCTRWANRAQRVQLFTITVSLAKTILKLN